MKEEKTQELLNSLTGDLEKDRKQCLKILKMNPMLLRDLPEEARKDEEIVLDAVIRSCGFALAFADESLKENRDFILKAVKYSNLSLMYAAKEFRQDEEVIKIVLRARYLSPFRTIWYKFSVWCIDTGKKAGKVIDKKFHSFVAFLKKQILILLESKPKEIDDKNEKEEEMEKNKSETSVHTEIIVDEDVNENLEQPDEPNQNDEES